MRTRPGPHWPGSELNFLITQLEEVFLLILSCQSFPGLALGSFSLKCARLTLASRPARSPRVQNPTEEKAPQPEGQAAAHTSHHPPRPAPGRQGPSTTRFIQGGTCWINAHRLAKSAEGARRKGTGELQAISDAARAQARGSGTRAADERLHPLCPSSEDPCHSRGPFGPHHWV